MGLPFSVCVCVSCVYGMYLGLEKCQGPVVTVEAWGQGAEHSHRESPGKSYCSLPCSYFSIMEHSLLEKITGPSRMVPPESLGF